MDQPKLERLFRLITMLTDNRKTTKGIAANLDCSVQSVQRYVDILRAVGYIVHDRSKGVPCVSPKSRPFKEIDELIHFTQEEALILKRLWTGYGLIPLYPSTPLASCWRWVTPIFSRP